MVIDYYNKAKSAKSEELLQMLVSPIQDEREEAFAETACRCCKNQHVFSDDDNEYFQAMEDAETYFTREAWSKYYR